MKANPSTAPGGKASSKRRNVHFRNPLIYDALQMAVAKGLVRANSASARLEQLITVEVRRLAPLLRKNGIPVPAEVFDK